MKDNIHIDLDTIRNTNRDKWIGNQRKGRGNILTRFEKSVPFWLIIVAITMYALSAPHTAAIFDKLTPNWGWIAPLGVEFALLYIAFRQKQVNNNRLRWLQYLFFFMAFVVNGAGSLMAVNSSAGISNVSAQNIISGISTLPLLSQVLLFLVPFNAVTIPLATVAVGEGVAELVKEYNAGDKEYMEAWKEVEQEILYQAVYQELRNQNVQPGRAQKQAQSEIDRYLQAAQAEVKQSKQTASKTEYVSFDEAMKMVALKPNCLNMTERELALELACSPHTARKIKLLHKPGL